MAVEKDPKEYVTLHASVLLKIVEDITECVRDRGWTPEQVQEAVQGAFCTAYRVGGTVDSVEQFSDLLMEQAGSPPDATKH